MRPSLKLLWVCLLVMTSAGVVRAENVLATAADAPTITLQSKQPSVTPGGQIIVEVFLSNVRDLATYEIRLNAVGGDRGSLVLEKISVDQQRADYVFKTANVQVIEAVDMSQQRVGMVRFSGGTTVAAGQQAYLGTFTFRASADAVGKFAISLGNPEAAFLNDSQAVQIPHRMSNNFEVNVGAIQPVREEGRKKQ